WKASEQSMERQSLSAIGQPLLMQIYNEIFRDFGIRSAQCLVTYRDFDNQEAQDNILKTLKDLYQNNFVTIINENDTIAIDEIEFGDNDQLSAYVAKLLGADILMLASDVDGLFDKNPQKNKTAQLIPLVTDIHDCKQFIDEHSNSQLGTGGMTSKILAAEICSQSNSQVWIVNGGNNNFILDAINDKIKFTKFIF
ncbi:MAG TPA: glutamate 5-kinase, partial [Oceanospirillales bacterium]|nr:glutamate 5-kinase [Oceanospirillales bacterium]